MSGRVFLVPAKGRVECLLILDCVRKYIYCRKSGGLQIIICARLSKLLAAVTAKVGNQRILLGNSRTRFALVGLRGRIVARKNLHRSTVESQPRVFRCDVQDTIRIGGKMNNIWLSKFFPYEIAEGKACEPVPC